MTVRIEVDEKVIEKVDAAAECLQESRTDFINKALNEAISKANQKLAMSEKEKRAIESYQKHPIQPDEFEVEESQLIEAWKDL